MREIKFRAWFTRDNTYVEPYTVQEMIFQKDSDSPLDVLYDEFEFEQYTGLKDTNGVDIYEGDIVQPIQAYLGVPNMKPSKRGLPIVVESGNYVYGKWIARDVREDGFGVNDYNFSEGIQVVGNIHENPELLDDK